MSQVCAPCLRSAATAPPLPGHRSYRLLKKDEREEGNIRRRRYYKRREKKKGNKNIWLPRGANCVPLQCVVEASHIHRMSTHAAWHSGGRAWHHRSCNINTFLPPTEKKPIMMESPKTAITPAEKWICVELQDKQITYSMCWFSHKQTRWQNNDYLVVESTEYFCVHYLCT